MASELLLGPSHFTYINLLIFFFFLILAHCTACGISSPTRD